MENLQNAVEKATEQKAVAEAALVAANDAKHAADMAVSEAAKAKAEIDRLRAREALAAEYGQRNEIAKAAGEAVSEAQAWAEAAAEAEKVAAAEYDTAATEYASVDFVLALAVADTVTESGISDAELVKQIPDAVADLKATDIRLRLGEFGSQGVPLPVYDEAARNAEHWLSTMRGDRKSLTGAFHSRNGWKRNAAALQMVNSEASNRALPETRAGMSPTEIEQREKRIERDEAEAEEYINND